MQGLTVLLWISLLSTQILRSDGVRRSRQANNFVHTSRAKPPEQHQVASSVITTCRDVMTSSAECACTEKLRAIDVIDCSNRSVESLAAALHGPVVTRTLNMAANAITHLRDDGFFGCSVQRLELSGNQLRSLSALSFWGLEFSLEHLNLSWNHLEFVPTSSLRLLRRLKSLILVGNRITRMNDNSFAGLTQLEILSISSNPVTEFGRSAFDGTRLYSLIADDIYDAPALFATNTHRLSQLKGLSLANNNLARLPARWLANMTSLRYVNLMNNELTSLKASALRACVTSLQTLKLGSNRLSHVPRSALKRMTELKRLQLSDNSIKKLPPRAFNSSAHLQFLDLSNNSIDVISHLAFHGLHEIREIDLRNNDLITMEERLLDSMSTKEFRLFLSGNRFVCNCLLRWMKKRFRRQEPIIYMFGDLMDMTCAKPRDFMNIPIVRVPLKELHCFHGYYYYYK